LLYELVCRRLPSDPNGYGDFRPTRPNGHLGLKATNKRELLGIQNLIYEGRLLQPWRLFETNNCKNKQKMAFKALELYYFMKIYDIWMPYNFCLIILFVRGLHHAHMAI